MKRFMSCLKCLAVLAVCLFSLTAAAGTVREQVAAPERARGLWHSPSGRTTVSLDAEILVPEVGSLPIVEVFPRIFEPQEVQALAKVLIGPEARQTNTDQGSGEGPSEVGPLPSYRQTGETISKLVTWQMITMAGGSREGDGIPDKMLIASYFERLDGKETRKAMSSLQYQFQAGKNLGRDVGAQEDAAALAAGVVAAIWPDMRLHSACKDLDIDIARISYENQPADYGYRFYFARQLQGVAVTPVSQQGAGESDFFFLGKQQRSYNLPLPYEKLFVDVGEDGIFQLSYSNPLRVGQTLQDGAALLPFDQVLDIFSRISPLKYAPFEYAENNGIQISRVVLGYMCLQIKDSPDRYKMTPVWDFFGIRTIDRERYEFDNESLFTVNALDGTVIDRDLGY